MKGRPKGLGHDADIDAKRRDDRGQGTERGRNSGLVSALANRRFVGRINIAS